MDPVMKEIGKGFGKSAAQVKEALLAMSEDAKLAMQAKLDAGETGALTLASGEEVAIAAAHVTIKKTMQKVSGKTFTPGECPRF